MKLGGMKKVDLYQRETMRIVGEKRVLSREYSLLYCSMVLFTSDAEKHSDSQ
jgi:hypothetical protein